MPQIDFVVVLMLENRSFDHLFGFHPGVNGLKGDEFNLLHPDSPESTSNPRFTVGQNAPFAIAKGEGPSHSLKATNVQLSGVADGPGAGHPVKLDGFVLSYSNGFFGAHIQPTNAMLEDVMQVFTPDRLPALNALADEFVLCDNWFAEVPGPTQPNRLYTHCASSQGFAFNDFSRTIDVDTIYNRLEAGGKNWAVYFSDDNDVAKFDRVIAKAYTEAAEEADFESDRAAGHPGAFLDFKTFFQQHCASGKLSSFNFIEPAFGDSTTTKNQVDSMHAPHDVRPGDQLIADVYEALRANEDVWKRSLLIVTFDEHGGFFDHVAPPPAVNPDGIDEPGVPAKGVPAFAFDRLGLRVPAILASPFLPKGKVVSRQYQHTSVITTVREIFGLSAPLTRRDAAAVSFADQLTGTFRNDTPAKLAQPAAAPQIGVVEAKTAPVDELMLEKAQGWQNILSRTTGLQPTRITTAEQAHEIMRTAVKDYANWKFERRFGAPPRS
ncbi:MAG TPA: alkaline phosphatase family protein [Bryobacteraceae bacterium]|nr:alkaline phosphatase family protein [Bryobacteraceae bacterium]